MRSPQDRMADYLEEADAKIAVLEASLKILREALECGRVFANEVKRVHLGTHLWNEGDEADLARINGALEATK